MKKVIALLLLTVIGYGVSICSACETRYRNIALPQSLIEQQKNTVTIEDNDDYVDVHTMLFRSFHF